MMAVLVIGLVVGGALICFIRKWKRWLRIIVDTLAVAAYIAFGVESADAIRQTVGDGTVFQTEVHHVFLNDVFLICGAYIGVYGLGFLMERLINACSKAD